MTILADEGIDRDIVDRLRGDGHDVSYVAEMEPGLPDEQVLARANAGQAILLTQDKDFGDLVFRQGLLAKGVVLLRLAGQTAAAKSGAVSAALSEHSQEIPGAFTVISARTVRIRRL